jgi:hypothetical protein
MSPIATLFGSYVPNGVAASWRLILREWNSLGVSNRIKATIQLIPERTAAKTSRPIACATRPEYEARMKFLKE